MNLKYVLIIALGLLASSISAQSNEHVRLLDTDDGVAIVGATFQYGNQKGISDKNGVISFNYVEGNTMKISHVSYGTWQWTDTELKQIIKNEVYYRSSIAVNQYPVTIIGIRQSRQPDEKMMIDFEERMEHDATDLLNRIPAFSSIRKSGNYGFDPVFRGFKYDQLNVVLNGAQSATAACPNRMDPATSQMAPNMMDRIEVLKGPYALRYGTGFGGTINFIPTKLRFTDKPEVYGRLSTGYESNGNIARSEGQIGISGGIYDLSLFGSWSQGDDYEAGNGNTVQSDFARGSFGGNLGLKVTSNQQVRLSATYNMARDADFPALGMDLREDDTWLFNARHDVHINGSNLQSWNTTVFGSFVNHLMDNLLKPIDPRMMNAETYAETFNYGGRTESVWHFGSGKLFAGADLRIEGAEGTRERTFLMGPNKGKVARDNAWQDGRIDKMGAFGEYHINTDALQFIFSGRLEYNTAIINDPTEEFLAISSETEVDEFNPGISVGIIKPIAVDLKAGLWLGRVQRSGSLTERFINYFAVGQDPYEMLGNPGLAPEVNNQIDLTFEWTNRNSSISIDVFAAYLQDYISSSIDTTLKTKLPTSPGVRRFTNIDEAYKTGFEFRWTQKLPLNLQSQLGIAYTYAEDLDRSEPLPEIPPLDLRFTLAGSYLSDKLSPEVSFRYVLEQDRISTEYGESITPAFTLLDVKIGYRITHYIRVNAGVNNLLDEAYYEHLNRSVSGTTGAIFMPGRNLFANLSIFI